MADTWSVSGARPGRFSHGRVTSLKPLSIARMQAQECATKLANLDQSGYLADLELGPGSWSLVAVAANEISNTRSSLVERFQPYLDGASLILDIGQLRANCFVPLSCCVPLREKKPGTESRPPVSSRSGSEVNHWHGEEASFAPFSVTMSPRGFSHLIC